MNLLLVAITDCISMTTFRLVNYILAFETHALSYSHQFQMVDCRALIWWAITDMIFIKRFILLVIIGVMLTKCKVPKKIMSAFPILIKILHRYATFSSVFSPASIPEKGLSIQDSSVPILFLSTPHHRLNRSASNGKCSWSIMLLKRSERFCIWGEMWNTYTGFYILKDIYDQEQTGMCGNVFFGSLSDLVKHPFLTTIWQFDPFLDVTSSMVKDPADVLDRQKCLDALAALRHAKWFQVRNIILLSSCSLMRCIPFYLFI